MSDVTNYDGRLEAMAKYCAAMLDNIAKVNNAYHDSVENAYTKVMPDALIDFKGVNKVGGRTVLWNQKINLNSASTTVSSVSVVADTDNTITYSGTADNNASSNSLSQSIELKQNHVYYVNTDVIGGSVAGGVGHCNWHTSDWGISMNVPNTKKKIYTKSSADSSVNIVAQVLSGVTYTDYKIAIAIIDMTEMLGVGNEPSTVEEAEAILTSVNNAYNAGELLNAGVTGIISKDADNNVLQTVSVPEEVQALEGYGISCPGAYNYIDYDSKKFVQAVASRDYETGDESDATVITDGTTTHYELAEPVETDIAEYIAEEITEAVSGGSLTFTNQYETNYFIPVPVLVEYIGV